MGTKTMHPKRRLKKVIAECEQLIRDTDYWNRLNPNEQPIDYEPERVMLSLARPCLDAWNRGDADEITRTADLLAEYAELLMEST